MADEVEEDVDGDTSFSLNFDLESRGEQERRRELSDVEEQGYSDPSSTSVGDVMVGPLTLNTTSSFTTTGNIQSTSTAPGDIHSTSTASGDIQSASTSDGNNQSTSTSDELRVDYAGAMADEVDVQQMELIRLQEAGKITLDRSKVVMSQCCYSVSETPTGRLLVGRNRGFDICNRDGSIARSVTVSTGHLNCIQYYNKSVYTLCKKPPPSSKRYVIMFDSNTCNELWRWSVPDYKYVSNIAVMYDKVYVSDTDSKQLCVYSLAGHHITNIEHATFSRPNYLTISSPDSIIISDLRANKVHKLNSRDDMVTWTCTAVDIPRGVYCDTNGDVWVWSDSTKSIFLLSSQTGEIISEIKHDVFTDMDSVYKSICGMCITREDRVLWAAATRAGLLKFPTM